MFTLTITGRPLYIIALYRHRYFTQKLFMGIKKDVQCQKYESFKNNRTEIIASLELKLWNTVFRIPHLKSSFI